ncbi:MAG: hypothetical protein CL755_08865, partial [Chloroflexi bacterium]|nr:hypothetical protein [Chloroflexota bacterium]
AAGGLTAAGVGSGLVILAGPMETATAVGTGVASPADCSFPSLASLSCWRLRVLGGTEAAVGC